MSRALKLLLVWAFILLFAATFAALAEIGARIARADVDPEVIRWSTGLAFLAIGAFNWRDFARTMRFVEFQRPEAEREN